MTLSMDTAEGKDPLDNRVPRESPSSGPLDPRAPPVPQGKAMMGNQGTPDPLDPLGLLGHPSLEPTDPHRSSVSLAPLDRLALLVPQDGSLG